MFDCLSNTFGRIDTNAIFILKPKNMYNEYFYNSVD
jgi:hypothetical protein